MFEVASNFEGWKTLAHICLFGAASTSPVRINHHPLVPREELVKLLVVSVAVVVMHWEGSVGLLPADVKEFLKFYIKNRTN